MSAEADMHDEVRKLRDEVGELKTTTRVTKHDVANLQQVMHGLTSKMEKLADQLTREMKETRESLSTEMRSELKLISLEINAINKTQAKSAGFYAGVISVAGVVVTLVMAVFKALFGGTQG